MMALTGHILTNLDSSVLHFDDIKAYKDALSTIDIREDVCFACAGYECKESLIAAICDFTLTLDGINLSIVYSPKKDGIKTVNKKWWKISVRGTGSQCP